MNHQCCNKEIIYDNNYSDDVIAEIKRKLNYNPNTGIFLWNRVEEKSHSDKIFNTKFAGKVAGSLKKTKKKNGYIEIHIKNKMIKAHRLAWWFVHGKWPEGEIDHFDNDRSNNKIENLRLSNRMLQNKNTSKRRDNKSGITGVHYSNRNGKWVAVLNYNNKRFHLGYFNDKFEAICARKSAENVYKFSENHGKRVSKW